MIYPSSCRFTKTKDTSRDPKPAGRHRFRDISPVKLIGLIRSLRHRRLRRTNSHRSSTLTHSRTFPLPFADHDRASHSSDRPPFPSPLSKLPSHHNTRCQLNARGIPKATYEDCSAGMSTLSLDLKADLSDVDRGSRLSQHPVSALPTIPSTFHLRSASTNDYLVEQLEQRLSRLKLGDASPDRASSFSRDIPMDVCPPSEVDSGKKPKSLPHAQNVIPTILITSVGSIHAKPLPPSTKRPSITPFGPSNLTNQLTNVSSTNSHKKASTDDPFAAQPHAISYPPDYNLTFRLPPFPLAPLTPCAPETPTPMCCDHFGDCSGDLWEIWHPPLVASRFTLPPFEFPPLSGGLFDDVSRSITPTSY